MANKILIVDDEVELQRAFVRMLEHEGYEAEVASGGKQALKLLEKGGIDLVILDVCMPEMSGIDVLAAIRESGNDVPTVVVSGAGTVDHAVQAIKLGAFDYVQKPLHRDRLLLTVGNALRFSSLRAAHQQLRDDLLGDAELIGEGPAMTRLKTLIDKVAPSDGRVLITGENGTGKEVVAASLHARSRRAEGPFVKVNCGAIPKDLVESELFGHEKGAFTGAISSRKGRFELADGGTLLLDEIGDMPMAMQVKLLRVLQEGTFERVGGTREIKVDVRVLAATNHDLTSMVEEGEFREDLYYRLNVVNLRVPPLRERREDVAALAQHFTRPGSRGDRIVLSKAALEALQHYDYPGNVRELQNVIERLAILHAGETIDAEAVRDVLAMASGDRRQRRTGLYEHGSTLKETMQEIERQIIVEAIAAHGNSKSAAAQALGTERSHFYKKCRAYGISGSEAA